MNRPHSNGGVLAGDIGGTKTQLAVFRQTEEPRKPIAEGTFPSGEYSSLELLLNEFLDDVNVLVERASFGVAGPVVGGRASVTNLPWTVDTSMLAKDLQLRSVVLLNDLVATAYAVPFLEPSELHAINAVKWPPSPS